MSSELCYLAYINLSSSDPDYENYSFSHLKYPVNDSEPVMWKELDYSDYIKLVAIVVIIVGGLLGNISVILTVALNRTMRTTINLYVANLAVADAMICIICMVPHLLSGLTKDIYLLGEFMCKFNPFTQMTCLTCSVLTLSAISCDRFMAIMFPLHVRITKQRTSVVMSIVWAVSLLVSIPFLKFKKHIVIEWENFMEPKCAEQWPVAYYWDENSSRCIQYEPYRAIYYLVISITLFFLPVVIMVTAYSLILWRLGSSKVPGEQHAANVSVHSRAKKKVNKMVFVVLVAFIICWTPLQVIVLYSGFIHNAAVHGQVPDWFDGFTWYAYYIAYANSFMNPIIYGGFNKTFRDGFCMILRCGYQKGRFGRPGSGITSSSTRTNALFKSLQSLNTTMTSLKSRTIKFFAPNPKVPTYQAELLKPAAV